ncbi:dTDP-4-amino-4,6-dideoxygalactose transaminase, partial [Candidatus Fermentibacterales bacterium]|nr:dTDP-4-amino-4,6-dideoxygalactose transaminase [Candidatus Fermentibacterales bacterium]
SGAGRFTRRCEGLLEDRLSADRVLLTTSCTHALEMAALLLDIRPGDEVIVPSFTFVSTVNAFVLRGATPVFADIRPDTLNMDERLLEGSLTDRTRAVVPVHYAGVGCEMEAILAIISERGVACVEDNAHGLFGSYRGRPLGTIGLMGTLSFHETKSYTCGEGGALIVNDASLVARAEVLREKGTDRSRFFRGEVDKYSWVDLGSSYVPSDMLAAFLLAQLESHEGIFDRRRSIWERYRDGLSDWACEAGVRLPVVPAHCGHAYHLFHVLMPGEDSRDAMLSHLRASGILAVFHYLPLHLSRMGRSFGGREGQCPVTESVSPRLLRLPFYNDLSESDQDFVIETVRSFGRA